MSSPHTPELGSGRQAYLNSRRAVSTGVNETERYHLPQTGLGAGIPSERNGRRAALKNALCAGVLIRCQTIGGVAAVVVDRPYNQVGMLDRGKDIAKHGGEAGKGRTYIG